MDKKLKPIGIAIIVLLAVSTFAGYNITVSEGATITGGLGFAEYDYYVVGGRNMIPTLPSPAAQPSDFTFTCIANNNATSTGYNFGNLTAHRLPETYLYDGNYESESPYNQNAYVTLNITNNLGYAVIIEDLTVEVTSGTSWEKYLYAGVYFSNFTVLMVDTLDQFYWTSHKHNISHPDQFDEVDYETGTVEVHRDMGYIDWIMGPNGAPRTPANVGPSSLVENDILGDALTTGHVATRYNESATPIILAPGANFTDYFGLTVWGAVKLGTQWDGTVTLRLTYKVPDTESVEEVAGVHVSAFYAYWPTYNDSTDLGFPEWSNLILNATVHNYGNVPINVRLDTYYMEVQVGQPLVPPPDAINWTHLFSQNVSIAVSNYTEAGFIWNFKASALGKGYYLVKTNATATQQGGGLAAYDDGFSCMYECRVLGDVDYDLDVDVGDQRKVQLAMFSSYGEENGIYEDWNGYPVFTDMDGDLDVDVGDQRKQQLWMFKSFEDP